MNATTATGSFPIGFRRGWTDWFADLPALVEWARAHGFGVVDLGRDGAGEIKLVVDSGLRVGSVDLPEWKGLISADPATRKAAVEADADHIRACGEMNHFVVLLPEDPSLPRVENLEYAVESLTRLVPICEQVGANIVIEGWPGPGALACTPEACRALFAQVDSRAIGLNYDPSHLIRMSIDPLRFLSEFVDRVHHVHAKDTEIAHDLIYEHGTEQPATSYRSPAFGGPFWRYAIPGHGEMRWTAAFRVLAERGYQGAVSVELEDERFNGTREGEQEGLLLSRRFLEGC